MTFSDIFKSSFLENVSSISVLDMFLTILLSFGIGLFIFLIYKKTYRGIMYSAGFGTTLIALTMITAIVILAVTSNVVLSLGMVGALSIVRFRTAIKDPLDIAFFVLVHRCGHYPGGRYDSAGGHRQCLYRHHFACVCEPGFQYASVYGGADHDAEVRAKEFLQKNVTRTTIKSKTAVKGATELNIEVRLKDEDTDFINILSEMPGIGNAVLVSYNGDYMG